MPILGFLKRVISPVTNIVDQVVKDKDQAAQLKYKLEKQLQETLDKELESQRDIIVAEAQGESWLQRNWRPVTMLSFVFILINNYILVPYAQAFGAPVPTLDIPPNMYGLLTVGIGGYVASRGVEKWKKMDNQAKLSGGN
nr:hypothetical protein 9 [Balneolaceae bacterium]